MTLMIKERAQRKIGRSFNFLTSWLRFVAYERPVSPDLGTYKYDLRLHSQTAISDIQHYNHPDAVGQRRFMKKGEKIYLETVMSSWWSHSRVNVGVIYHGKTEGGGTWLDGVQKAHFNGRAQDGFRSNGSKILTEIRTVIE